LVTAGLGSARDHALVSLLALNGLRVSEAIGANIEALGLERGHRTLTVVRKGGKTVTLPLAPRVARAIDLAVAERIVGPIFIEADGRRVDRHAAGRIVRRIARRAGIGKRVGPHTLRHAFITAALDAGVPLRDVQEAASHADPRTTNAVRPWAPVPRPARHLHRRHLHRRRRTLTKPTLRRSVLPTAPDAGPRSDPQRTHRRANNVDDRNARRRTNGQSALAVAGFYAVGSHRPIECSGRRLRL
jgi:integrase